MSVKAMSLVGLDVHARQTHAAVFVPDTGEVAVSKLRMDLRVIEIAWRAQRRLYSRWGHLHHDRRKHAGVVAIACARELAAFLWEAATLD